MRNLRFILLFHIIYFRDPIQNTHIRCLIQYVQVAFTFVCMIWAHTTCIFNSFTGSARGYNLMAVRGESCRRPLCCWSHSGNRERLGCESNEEERTWTDWTSFRYFSMSLMNNPLQIQRLTVIRMDGGWKGCTFFFFPLKYNKAHNKDTIKHTLYKNYSGDHSPI